MKKLESSLTNMVLVLVGVAVVMGCILAFMNHLTSGPIQEQKDKALAEGIKAVMGVSDLKTAKTDTLKQNDDKGKEQTFIIYHVEDASGKALGAAVESTTMGFGGDLKVLVGFDTEGKILGYTLLEHAETPGLGAKADKWFQKDGKGNIVGKNPATPLDVKPAKGGKGDVEAITASTITTRAFLKAVNNAYTAYKAKTAQPSADKETMPCCDTTDQQSEAKCCDTTEQQAETKCCEQAEAKCCEKKESVDASTGATKQKREEQSHE